MTTIVYRVYEADQGLDIEGGVALPEVSVVSDDGSQRQALPDCQSNSVPSTQSVTDALAGSGSGAGNNGIPSAELGGQDPPVWLHYTNLVNGVGNGVLDNPRTGRGVGAIPQATDVSAGRVYDNLDNAYMTTFDSSSSGTCSCSTARRRRRRRPLPVGHDDGGRTTALLVDLLEHEHDAVPRLRQGRRRRA